jgi:hypothetical protein
MRRHGGLRKEGADADQPFAPDGGRFDRCAVRQHVAIETMPPVGK